MDSGKILLGVVAGIAVGAALGILMAPEKGVTTRKKIADGSDDLADSLQEKFNEFIESVAKQFSHLKSEAVHSAENGSVKVKEAVAEAVAEIK